MHLAGQIQIVAINTTAMVAGDDREGRNIGFPVILLVQAVWTSYLLVYGIGIDPDESYKFTLHQLMSECRYGVVYIHFLPFAIMFAKMIFKLYAFYKVRQSYAFGRNPRLVVGYMEQPQPQDGNHHSEHAPPPLLVMGEDTVQVEKQPHGHVFIRMSEEGGATDMGMKRLVTMDKVWQLDDMLLGSTATQLKDVCLSFSLFKLLRCRFARYTIAKAGFHKVYSFFWQVLMDGRSNDERVLGIITDELCFLYDYYYTSLPISYPNHWLPILSSLTSLLSIIYGLLVVIVSVVILFASVMELAGVMNVGEVSCSWECSGTRLDHEFGSAFFILLPAALLGILVVLTETREIASYICSNWTKVALICSYTNHVSWQHFRAMQKCIRCVLRCRCKLLKHWEDKMSQCSILVLHPRKTPLALLRRLIGLPDQRKKVEVPRAVKSAVLDTLRSYEGSTGGCVASYRRSLHVGDDLHWPFNGKGTTDTILVYHIATSILDVRSQQNQHPSNHKIVATHLSRYCAYLVAYSPELLPDDDAWCKSLYKAVKKDADRILAGGVGVSTMPEEEYQRLVEMMIGAGSKHEVLEKGVELGKMLAGLVEEEEMVWEDLAGFWSEMIMYVAPSDNLDGHAEAVARGGELVTVLWALLAHVGIVSRTDDDDDAAAAAAAAATASVTSAV